MSRFIDITGQRFGRLTVLVHVGSNDQNRAMWKCRCDCGELHIVESYKIRSGHTKSCGCLHEEVKRSIRSLKLRHGQCDQRLHRIWKAMKTRCTNPKSSGWKWYGARGISVCEQWRESFEAFRDWALANGYSDDLSIDREDNDGNYEPGNCRWATRSVQNNNQRPRRSKRDEE